MTCKSYMFLLLAILALGDTRVYIYFLNSSDIAAYVGAFINQVFSFCTTLGISNIDPNNNHIIFR